VPVAVDLAWCHTPTSLAATVARHANSGRRNIAIVVLGASESGPLAEVESHLNPLVHSAEDLRVTFAAPIWNDRALPARLVERILAAAGVAPADVGVVLVGEGAPPAWERRFSAAGAVENYFNQRVRALLAETGVDERRVRMAWLEWQTPDVTEEVRHAAVLGCTRIVVAPSTIALPTLEMGFDLKRAVGTVRVPDGVQVVTLSPWEDDKEFAAAIVRSVESALAESRCC
jgi:protoheme ferro-lyase